MSIESTSLEAKKEALSRQTEIYKQAIGEQVNIMKDNAGLATKRVVIVGASIAASFFLIRALTNRNGKKKLKQLKRNTSQKLLGSGMRNSSLDRRAGNTYNPANSTKETSITGLITQQIAIFLIGIATQKLQEYFNNTSRKHTEPISRDDKEYIEPIIIK